MEGNERKNPEKAILAGLDAGIFTREETATEETLDELRALLETAGGECVGLLLQSRPAPDPHSFLGEGKAQELATAVEETGADMVIFDNDLSPSQMRNLEMITRAAVMDRSQLILDIFAQRAKTREGRLQVELAQYQYILPRLSGMGKSLSRQGGGIGTRGPGETQLETDRRHIRERISRLKNELKEVRRVRGVQRQKREKNNIPVVALVGYTNAGKSTLLNSLTGAGIPANNRLFDTLDTTTRRLTVSDTLEVLLSDTVGFIAKLPHHLVEAFQATLEELQYADLLLHVIDCSDPNRESHMEVVEKLIGQLAPQGVPVIEVYNKADLVSPELLPVGENKIAISAATKTNLSGLLELIDKNLDTGVKVCRILLPYTAGGELDRIHREAKVLSEEYQNDGILIEAALNQELLGRYREYIR
ncbi:MAG: GTPase HflX [Oscillospiraceae bacterium]|nr:GTPase HflX [Oscillospiraceae bacterium]